MIKAILLALTISAGLAAPMVSAHAGQMCVTHCNPAGCITHCF